EHGGAARARNQGAARATGDIILFLDDDMICDPEIIEQHARMYREGADAVTGEVFLDPHSPRTFITNAVERWISIPRPATADEPFQIYTGQLSVRQSAFRELGGFDEYFTCGGAFGHEDTDFGVKLLKCHCVRHNPKAISWQRYMIGPTESMRRTPLSAQADMRFLARYPHFAERVFNQRGRKQLRTRLLYWPLSAVPLAARVAQSLASVIAEAAMKTPLRSSRWLGYVFFAARSIVYWSAIRRQGGIPNRNSLLVLCYHSIQDRASDPILGPYSVPPEQFASQLNSLKRRGFTFVGPDALAAFVNGEASLPRRAVLLTFDDCYEDLLEAAREVLRPRGIQAIAFAVTGMKSGTNAWDTKEGAQEVRLLCAAQLKELAKLGIEIGAHSRTHRNMRLLEPQELGSETRGACEDLVVLGLPKPRFFSYPYGALDSESLDAVRSAGYVGALGIWVRHADPKCDRFHLPRVPVLASDNSWSFRLKTSFPRSFSHMAMVVGRAAKVLGYDPPFRLV
ncbi:MAG TPA: polysaccharide deacetylase family protein, partial [Sphingomicrobium sp.]|nr:polysaccharide deacetylase family protein [Sphingomicrobium sp.]